MPTNPIRIGLAGIGKTAHDRHLFAITGNSRIFRRFADLFGLRAVEADAMLLGEVIQCESSVF